MTYQADNDNPDAGPGARLRLFAEQSKALHEYYLAEPARLSGYSAFVTYQTDYMAGFYKDLRTRPGYADALDFVITDLTGIGISQRDQDLARVVPVMVRMLPDKALETLAAAMELNAAVLRVNLAVCDYLFDTNGAGGALSEARFCAAYRHATALEDCLALATLTRQLGENLQRIIKIRALGFMLRAMQGPAHVAGFGALHGFLKTGYERFHAIDDVPAFLDQMHGRMIQVLTRIFEVPMESLCTTPTTAGVKT